LANGSEVKRDPEEAARYFRLAADVGDGDNPIAFSERLIRGDGVGQNLLEAGQWLWFATSHECVPSIAKMNATAKRWASRKITLCSVRSRGDFARFIRDPGATQVFFRLLVAIGDDRVKFKCVQRMAKDAGHGQYRELTERCFQSIAASRDLKTKFKYATWLARRKLNDRDLAESARLIRAIADDSPHWDDLKLKCALHLIYALGGPHDLIDGARYCREAAERYPDHSANVVYAHLCKSGLGVERDSAEEAKYTQRWVRAWSNGVSSGRAPAAFKDAGWPCEVSAVLGRPSSDSIVLAVSSEAILHLAQRYRTLKGRRE
jgi:TPR repeat protein